MAKRAPTIRNVKRLISSQIRKDSEIKFQDTELSGFTSIGPGLAVSDCVLVDMFGPAQGVAEQNRVGNKVRLQSIQIRAKIQGDINPLTTEARNFRVRVIFFQYHPMSNGASAPLPANLLSGTTSPWAHVNSPILPNQMHDFTIWYDKTFTVGGNYVGATLDHKGSDNPNWHKHLQLYFTKFPKYFDRTVKFAGNASVNGHNKVYMLVLSDADGATAGTDSMPCMNWFIRVRFLDD